MFSGKVLVSVDVDSLHHYLGLYGKASEDVERLISLTWELGVERFSRVFSEHGYRGVFFVVGSDLRRSEVARRVLKGVVGAGHVPGNHTMSHNYDFINLPGAEAYSEVKSCEDMIVEACGVKPAIFRAPGYNMTEDTYRVIEDAGYRYDSSPLPSYSYLMLKYAVMSGLRVMGKRSHSIWGNPRHFMGGRLPYRRGGLWVMPCAVGRVLRVPLIGTSVVGFPEWAMGYLEGELAGLDFVCLEFHAVDLMSLEDDGLGSEFGGVRELSGRLGVKEARVGRVLDFLSKRFECWVP